MLDAVLQANQYISEGYRWVGIDGKFFDKVNRDILMSRVARIKDKRVLKLIRLYLNPE